MKRYSDLELSADTCSTVKSACASIGAAIAHYPNEETKTVRRLAKIGGKTDSFTRDALAEGKSFPELLPRFLDPAKFARDIATRDALIEQLFAIEQLAEKVRVAVTLLGVDIYADGLVVYSSLKRGKEPAAREAAKRLSRCFKRKPRKKKMKESAGAGADATVQVPASSGRGAVAAQPQDQAAPAENSAPLPAVPVTLASLAPLAAPQVAPHSVQPVPKDGPTAPTAPTAKTDDVVSAGTPQQTRKGDAGTSKLRGKPRLDAIIDRQNRRPGANSRAKGRTG